MACSACAKRRNSHIQQNVVPVHPKDTHDKERVSAHAIGRMAEKKLRFSGR